MGAIAFAVKGTANRHGILKGAFENSCLKIALKKYLLKVSSSSPNFKHHSAKIPSCLMAAAFCSALVSNRFIDL
jgi:hypothetical protein